MSPKLACVVVVGLIAPLARAEDVDEIVARHLAVRGGAARIAAIRSLRVAGKARGPRGREARVVRELKRPGMIRTEITAQGLTGVYAFDGRRGWQVSLHDGEFEPRPMLDAAARQAGEQADIDGPLLDWKAKGHRVELIEREAVEGREAWKLKVTLGSGAVRHLFIDTQSHMHVRTEGVVDVGGRELAIEATFGDHRESGGVLFPHRIVSGVKGRPERLRISVEKVEIDAPLDDTRFRMPEVKP